MGAAGPVSILGGSGSPWEEPAPVVAVVDAQPAAFEAVYWGLYVRAFRLAYRILDDRGEAEDVAADALARAHLHWGRVGSLPYRDAWVLRVAGNLARTVVRRRRRAAPEPNPEPALEENVVARVALAAAVSSLPRRQREAITMRYLAGLGTDEIGACLRISPVSVRTHIRRGLRTLRAQLSLEEGDDALDD
jgi:RNA polymerase sigma-70 factor, ECF subfamily